MLASWEAGCWSILYISRKEIASGMVVIFFSTNGTQCVSCCNQLLRIEFLVPVCSSTSCKHCWFYRNKVVTYFIGFDLLLNWSLTFLARTFQFSRFLLALFLYKCCYYVCVAKDSPQSARITCAKVQKSAFLQALTAVHVSDASRALTWSISATAVRKCPFTSPDVLWHDTEASVTIKPWASWPVIWIVGSRRLPMSMRVVLCSTKELENIVNDTLTEVSDQIPIDEPPWCSNAASRLSRKSPHVLKAFSIVSHQSPLEKPPTPAWSNNWNVQAKMIAPSCCNQRPWKMPLQLGPSSPGNVAFR